MAWFKSKKKAPAPSYQYDPSTERPIIRASICTGEQVAGFKNRHTGEFHEVMLIRDDEDKGLFMKMYGLTKVEKEY